MREGPRRNLVAHRSLGLALGFLAALLLVAVPARAPAGRVVLESPEPDLIFEPGEQIAVRGRVIETTGAPIGGVNITARLVTPVGETLPGTVRFGTSATPDGSFVIPVPVPPSAPDGTYTLEVDASDAAIQDEAVSIRIRASSPVIGVPLWTWIVLISAVTAAALGGLAYALRAGRGAAIPRKK